MECDGRLRSMLPSWDRKKRGVVGGGGDEEGIKSSNKVTKMS